MAIATVDDLIRVSEMLYRGGCCPPGVDNPAKVATLILAGQEVGLGITQSLASVKLSNGRPSLYGDAPLALVRRSGLLESIAEEVAGTGDDRSGVCRVKRRGEPERVFRFAYGEAVRAGLIERSKDKGKGAGPWITYPDRMLQARARGFALRDVFPDVLMGMLTEEEAADLPPIVVGGVTGPALPPAADRPSPPAAAELRPAGLATGDQLVELTRLRNLLFAAAGPVDDPAKARLWAGTLMPYGVSSARDLGTAQAAELIDSLGRAHDPFGYPATGGSPPPDPGPPPT